jgi:beta-glucosidase
MPFPPDFLWGASTSSYQIEGAVHEDGRGPSIWDTFSHTPGNVENGDTGDIADDHYHRWADDVALMADLGLPAYHFSIGWPRLFPDGGTTLNERGLAFYDRLVDALLERNITPVVTLFHWDLPQALQDRGGWVNRDTVEAYTQYARTCFERLGDRVPIWITQNEPWVVAILGYLRGIHAPGHTNLQEMLDVSHHLLLSHGSAVQAYRSSGRTGQIGITLNLFATYPKTDTDADRAAVIGSDGYTNRRFLDPLLLGSYPQDTADIFAAAGADALAAVKDGDLATIAAPADFLGVNYYNRRVVSADTEEFGWKVEPAADPGINTSDLGWEITPEGLYDLLTRLKRDYPPIPIYITENGISLDDRIGPDGNVDDPRRIEYLRAHFEAAQGAMAEGVDLRGYFVWSLFDNFEWAMGYRPRFGLVYVDYSNGQRRIPKSSAQWYASVIRANGLP